MVTAMPFPVLCIRYATADSGESMKFESALWHQNISVHDCNINLCSIIIQQEHWRIFKSIIGRSTAKLIPSCNVAGRQHGCKPCLRLAAVPGEGGVERHSWAQDLIISRPGLALDFRGHDGRVSCQQNWQAGMK